MSIDFGCKVLNIIPAAQSDRAYVFVQRQIERLKREGIESEIFWFVPSTSPINFISARSRFKNLLESFKPDLVHAHYGTFAGLLASCQTKIPVIVTFRGCDLYGGRHLNPFKRLVARIMSQFSARRATKVICVSEALRKKLWGESLRSRATVIPQGVDTALFKPLDQRECRLELGWKQESKVVLFSSGDWPRIKVKRLDMAQESIKLASAKVDNLILEDMAGQVTPAKVPLYMNASDCLLLTSDSEGSPNVVKEAMACNLPVVAVNVGDVEHLLQGVSPSLVVEQSPQDIAAALVELLLSKGGRSNGRSRVQRIVSEELMTAKLIDIYRSTVLNSTKSD